MENPPPPRNPALKFQISKITIGQWSRSSVNPGDLVAKCYFGKKKLIWEIMGDDQEGGAQIQILKKRMEIPWVDVLSLKSSILRDGIEVLEVELSKPPTFFTEIDPQPGKHSLWTQTDKDFTTNQSASICRRHTLHFAHGVLQKNLEKIQSGDSFWSELVKVSFPRLQDPYFDNGGGNNNLAHQSQGFGHVGVGHGNLNMAIQLGAKDGRQTNASAGEVPYPPLNLTLTITPEFNSLIESVLHTEERNSMSGYGNSLNNNSNLDVNRSLDHQGSGIKRHIWDNKEKHIAEIVEGENEQDNSEQEGPQEASQKGQ